MADDKLDLVVEISAHTQGLEGVARQASLAQDAVESLARAGEIGEEVLRAYSEAGEKVSSALGSIPRTADAAAGSFEAMSQDVQRLNAELRESARLLVEQGNLNPKASLAAGMTDSVAAEAKAVLEAEKISVDGVIAERERASKAKEALIQREAAIYNDYLEHQYKGEQRAAQNTEKVRAEQSKIYNDYLEHQFSHEEKVRAKQSSIYDDYLKHQAKADADYRSQMDAGAARLEKIQSDRLAGETKEFNRQMESRVKAQQDSLKGLNYDAHVREYHKVADAQKVASEQTAIYNDYLWHQEQAAQKSSESIISLRYANYDLATTLLGTSAAITAVGAASLTAFASQERAFTDVERTLQTNVLPEQVEEIEEALRSLSTQIPLTFNQLSEIATIGNQMGIEADNIVDFTNTIARFSAITGISIESTTEAFGGFMAQTGMAPELLENLGSAIAKVGIDSNATEEQILSLMREITAGATGAGFATEQIVALSGTLASLQIAPERARGSLTTYFETLNKAVASGGKALQDFAQVVGVPADELERMVRAGEGNKVLRGFLEGLQDLDNIDTTRALDDLGLAQLRVTDTFRRLSGSLQLYDRDQQNANQAFQEASELQRQYAMIVDDLASKFQILLNALMNFGAQVGEVLAPAFGRLIDLTVGGLKALTDFAQSPVGEALVRITATIASALAVWAALRGAIALATASAYAFSFIVRGLGGAGIGAALVGMIKAFAGIKTAADGATVATLSLRSALLALGRAVVIGAVLSYVAEWIFNTGEAAYAAGDALTWMANAATNAFFGIADAIAQVSPYLATVFAVMGVGFSPNVNPVAGTIQGAGRALRDWGAEAIEARAETERLQGALFDASGILEDFSNTGPDAMDDLGNSAADATREVRTLVDYANDLRQVWDRAFEIRFSGSQTLDAITSSFISIRKASEEAAKRIRDLNNDIQSLSSDIDIQEYFLSIAVEYGDTKRAAAIEAELAKMRAELADKTNELREEQDSVNKSLVGNSESAIENRKTIEQLVQQYQAHIGALAASGMSQADLAVATERLRQDFIQQATQLGFNRAELELYASAFDDVAVAISQVPRNITVTASADPAIQAFNELMTAANNASGAVSGLRSNLGTGMPAPYVNTSSLVHAGRQAEAARLRMFFAQNAFNPNAAPPPYTRAGAMAALQNLIAMGYSGGGYTGPGGRNEPAGIVHKGEYVISKQDVNQRTGLPYADALGRLMGGIPGMASGGPTTGSGAGSSIATVALTPGTIQAIAQATGKAIYLDGRLIADSAANSYANDNSSGRY